MSRTKLVRIDRATGEQEDTTRDHLRKMVIRNTAPENVDYIYSAVISGQYVFATSGFYYRMVKV